MKNILTRSPMENNKQTQEETCSHCNVPTDVHGTCCGWQNASLIVNLSGFIIDKRHPKFGAKAWNTQILPKPYEVQAAAQIEYSGDRGKQEAFATGVRWALEDVDDSESTPLQARVNELKVLNDKLSKALEGATAGYEAKLKQCESLREENERLNSDLKDVKWQLEMSEETNRSHSSTFVKVNGLRQIAESQGSLLREALKQADDFISYENAPSTKSKIIEALAKTEPKP